MNLVILVATILLGSVTSSPVAVNTAYPTVDVVDLDTGSAGSTLANTPDTMVSNGVIMKSKADTSDELTGPCRKITFIYARGSTQRGNMGPDIGPGISMALKTRYGSENLATQGLNYKASLDGNLEKQGCDAAGIATFIANLQDLATRCPESKVVVAGYSQGAACLHAAFRGSDAETLEHVVAAVTFGDTRKKQDGGRFPNFPSDNSLIICEKGDPVCNGTIVVGPGHFRYLADVETAVDFLEARLGTVDEGESQ